MKSKVFLMWGAAVICILLASTMEDKYYPTTNPAQTALFYLAGFLFLFPIFVGGLVSLFGEKK